MFIREQLGTGTGKGLARALNLTASAGKMQNGDNDKQIGGWEIDKGLFWWLLIIQVIGVGGVAVWSSCMLFCPKFLLVVSLYFSSLSSNHFCIFSFQIIFVFLLELCFYNSF